MYRRQPHVALVGAGMGERELLTGEAREMIEKADVLVGSARMLTAFGRPEVRCLEEYRPGKITELIRDHPEYRRWAVLLSGDVGFYSGAKGVAAMLREEGLDPVCVPGIASIVYLAARLGVSWEDAALRSIHGRKQNIIYAVSRHEKTFLLLDSKSAPAFCEALRKYGLGEVICYVGNCLSGPDERIIERKGSEIRPEDIGDPATLLVMNPDPERRAGPHLRDEEFLRGDGDVRVPMTKEEVRAVSMAKLELTEDAVLYDIGAGTGSVSVEAALHGEKIRVYAVEQRAEACDLIERNKRKFRTDQVRVVRGRAPEALEGLEAPTHVFIGGSGGKLKEIIRRVKDKNPAAVLVINAVTMETVGEVMAALEEGLLADPDILQLGAARASVIGGYHLMKGQNPVYIITERR